MIPASDHNDVIQYVESGLFRINTLQLCIQGVSSSVGVIGTAGEFKPVKMVNRSSSGTTFYASDGTTVIAVLDDNGNLGVKGQIYTL